MGGSNICREGMRVGEMETSQKPRKERGGKNGGEGVQVYYMQGSLFAAVPPPSCSQSTLGHKASLMSMENP